MVAIEIIQGRKSQASNYGRGHCLDTIGHNG